MFPATVLIESICFACAVIFLRKGAGYWTYFIWFMLFITLIDGTGWLMAVFRIRNHWLYNIQLPVETVFTGWVLYILLKPLTNSKPWFLTGLAVFFVSFFTECFVQGFLQYADFTSSLASLLFVVAACCYFYYQLKHEEPVDLLRHPPFWIVSGILLFYFSSSATNIFFQELMQLNIVKGIPLRYFIFIFLNAILYGCWIYAFRCRYLQTI